MTKLRDSVKGVIIKLLSDFYDNLFDVDNELTVIMK